MTSVIDVTGVREPQWVREITAWPAAYPVSGTDGDSLARLQTRVVTAVAAELTALDVGERLRMVTAFEAGSITSALYRTGSVGSHSSLGAVLGLEPWVVNADPWPPIGGHLVTRVSPIDPATRQLVPYPALAGLRFDDDTDATMWTAMVEQLASSPLPIAVVVEAERRYQPSTAQQVLQRGLAGRAQARADRRGVSCHAVSAETQVLGDIAVDVGVVGDLGRFASVWATNTALGLRSGGEDMPGPLGVNARLVGANDAARLFPVPVLAGDSQLPVPRHRPRSSAVTHVPDPKASVMVAVSDAGKSIGLDPTRLNTHLLVLGDSGSGKSLTTMSLLRDIWERFGVPWLVIDPLKYEYARMEVRQHPIPAGPTARIRVRHLLLGQVPLNPLAIPDGVDPLGYASAMAQAFSSVTSLGDQFPLGEQFVRAAFNDLYSARTRDPTLADLEAAFMAVGHQEMMAGETARNVSTSLLGRLRSITSGVAGDVFSGGPNAGIDWASLSQFPTVITFPRGIGEQERAVIYAMLVTSHWSWRMANPTNGRHVIVLEELHQIYGRDNPAATRMLNTLLATMRESGQGYFGITQSPHQLDEMTQRLFTNVLIHRVIQHSGLAALDVLGLARQEVADLADGEVLAVLGTPHGVRGRVPDRSGGAGQLNAMVSEPSHRAREFTRAGPVVRGWCLACPRPCTGRSWLEFAEPAAHAADRALADGADTTGIARAAVRAVVSCTSELPANRAGVYCAAARGVSVALGIRSASEVTIRAACHRVRANIPDSPSASHAAQ